MKYAVKRKGFCSTDVKQVAERSNGTLTVVLCLANESCAIGSDCFTTLRNFLVRSFRKYAKIYGVSICLHTGKVDASSPLNRRYANRRSEEIDQLDVKQKVMAQLGRRFWWYLEEVDLRLWMPGLEDELEAESDRLARLGAARTRRLEQGQGYNEKRSYGPRIKPPAKGCFLGSSNI